LNPTLKLGNADTQVYRGAVNNKTIFTNNGIDIVNFSGTGGQDTIGVIGNVNITTNYDINGIDVLNATTLGIGVVSSSLTSVGNLTSLIVDGNLTVNGMMTTVDTSNLTIEDPLMKLANKNTGDSIDTGFYSLYNDGVSKYSGLFRDSTDNTFKFFTGTTIEPDTIIDTSSDNGYLKGDILVGSIDATSLTVDTNTLHVDSSNNRIGVGTITPSVPLDVVGDINTSTDYNISGTQVLSSTTLGTGIVNSSLTSNTGNLVNTGTMNITTGNDYQINSTSVLNATTLGSSVVNSSLTSVGTLDSLSVAGLTTFVDLGVVNSLGVTNHAIIQGNIGVGSSSTPTNYLHLSVSDSSNSSQVTIHNESDVSKAGLGLNAGNLNFNLQLDANTQEAIIDNLNGDIGFYAKDIGDHRFYTTDSNTERLTILNDGNVGIGTDTPSKTLDVYGPNANMVIHSTGQNEDSTLFLSTPYDTDAVAKTAIIAEGANTWSRSDLHFCLNNDANQTTEVSLTDSRMTISYENGYVGINETNPNTYLHINHTKVGDATVIFPAITLSWDDAANANTQTGDGLKISFETSSVNNGAGSVESAYIAAIRTSGSEASHDTDLVFATKENSGGSVTERMRINNVGYLGINNTNPTVELDVVGSITYTGTISDVSDMRVKENIITADYNQCYENIKNIELRDFEWKDDFFTYSQKKNKKETGFIAQEVEAVLPNAISTRNKFDIEDFKTIERNAINANLYGAVKKLMEKIELLEEKLSSIETNGNIMTIT
jgi:hypothetical protein